MVTPIGNLSPLYRFWNAGQEHLVAGRYVAARSSLESAERIAWRLQDYRSLARIYLPLLEARRQIRYNAAEGSILFLSAESNAREDRDGFKQFLGQPAGVLLIMCSSRHDLAAAHGIAKRVYFTSRRMGGWLESLLILNHGGESRLVPTAHPNFSGGLPIIWTTDAKNLIGPSTDPALVVPLPPPALYINGPLHVLARESLLIAWEALALRWQHRHPPNRNSTVVAELAWLRRTLEIDPGCEPVTMRLIALAEAADRR